MAALKMTDPDGRRWTVRRHWAHRVLTRGVWSRLQTRRRSRRREPRDTDWTEVADAATWLMAGYVYRRPLIPLAVT